MRSFAAFAVVAALLPVAPAAAGSRVTWPESTTVRPGDSVTVAVRSTRTVRAALLRLSDAGRPFRTVAAKQLRIGRFVAVVPQETVVRRYLLVVDDRGRRRSRTIVATPPPPPLPPAQPVCAEAGSKVETSIDRRAAARGEVVTMTIRNAGPTCLGYGADFSFERWTGERWQSAGDPMRAWPSWAAGLSPGETIVVTTEVWPELEPGPHRLAKYFEATDGVFVAAEQIDVTG